MSTFVSMNQSVNFKLEFYEKSRQRVDTSHLIFRYPLSQCEGLESRDSPNFVFDKPCVESGMLCPLFVLFDQVI